MTALGLRAGEYSLFVGTVEPRKNVERLVQAYGMLPERMRSDWPLVIAGARGWNSDSIHACIEKAQAQGWARYISYVDQSWLPALYAGARLMAYPSLYEGFGLPIVEALASGTPVLTSRVSCMPEVAGGAAWLVDCVFRRIVTADFGIVTAHFGHRDRAFISAHRDRPFRDRDRPFRRS